MMLDRIPGGVYLALGGLIAAGIFLSWLFYSLGRKQTKTAEPPVDDMDANVMLYPRSKTDIGQDRQAQHWIQELVQYGFAEAGKYVVYSQDFRSMQRRRAIVDGFANAKENIYAAVHSSESLAPYLELFTPYAEGSSLACSNAAGPAIVFNERTPKQQVVSGEGRGVMEMLDLAAKSRPAGEMLPVSPEGFRDAFLRREFEYRAWQSEHVRELNSIDMEIREELYRNAGRLLTNPQDIAMRPERFVIIHNRYASYDLLYAIALAGGLGAIRKHSDDSMWREMTPRELFRHAVTQKWLPGLTPLLSLDAPHPADVYLNGAGETA